MSGVSGGGRLADGGKQEVVESGVGDEEPRKQPGGGSKWRLVVPGGVGGKKR